MIESAPAVSPNVVNNLDTSANETDNLAQPTIQNTPTAHAKSAQFGLAPANFAANTSAKLKDLATDLGWPQTDQGMFNLLALMRVSGGSDGYFDTGDLVSGAISMGYQIDSQKSLQTLADFRGTFKNGTTGNDDSMKAALEINSGRLTELAGNQDLSKTMFTKTDTPAATKLFHDTVRGLATAISQKDTSAWTEKYPWLKSIDLMNLNYDWHLLGLKDPTPGGKAEATLSDEIAGNSGEYVSSL